MLSATVSLCTTSLSVTVQSTLMPLLIARCHTARPVLHRRVPPPPQRASPPIIPLKFDCQEPLDCQELTTPTVEDLGKASLLVVLTHAHDGEKDVQHHQHRPLSAPPRTAQTPSVRRNHYLGSSRTRPIPIVLPSSRKVNRPNLSQFL